MASVRVLCLVALVLFALFQTGTSIKCYKCDANTKSCETDENAVDCAAKEICLNIRYPDDKLYSKECGTEKYCELFKQCSSCEEEKCNSSSAVLPTFLVFGVVSAVIAKYFY